MEYKSILYEVKDGVAVVTFNRPESYNCYTTETLEEVRHAVTSSARNDSISVIVLTGAGTRAFCTGGDVKEYASNYIQRPHAYYNYMNIFRSAIESILRAGKPVIARLNGMAVGGGNEFNLACDLSIIGNHTYVGQIGTSVGSVACGGATQWLPITAGAKRASEMLMFNSRVPAKKALEWGLVNAVARTVKQNGKFIDEPNSEQIEMAQKKQNGFEISFEELDSALAGWVANLKEKFPECIRYTKTQVNFWKELSWNNTVAHAADWLTLHFATNEPFEGMSAFAKKRKTAYAQIREKLASGKAPEYTHGAPVKKCSVCSNDGIPDDFKFCGFCGKAI